MYEDQNLLGEWNISIKAVRFSLVQRYCTTNSGLLQNERILTTHLQKIFSESHMDSAYYFCIATISPFWMIFFPVSSAVYKYREIQCVNIYTEALSIFYVVFLSSMYHCLVHIKINVDILVCSAKANFFFSTGGQIVCALATPAVLWLHLTW